MSLNTPLLALRNIGLSTRDLMEAINRRHSYIDNDIDGYATGQNALLFPAQPISKEAASVGEFTCFGQLPSEIRIKIWQYACYHPRNIDIFTETLGSVKVKRFHKFQSYKYFTLLYSHPAILHTSKESREEGLKHYELQFGTSHKFSTISITTPARIYVNSACDRICLFEPGCFESSDGGQFLDFIDICAKNNFKSVAINIQLDFHWPFVDVSTAWDSLEELILFDLSSYIEGQNGDIGFVRTEDLAAYCNPSQFFEPDVQVAMNHLRDAKRDFLRLFEMHKAGVESIMASCRDVSSLEETSWNPPRVEIMHLTIGDKTFPRKWPYGR